MQEDFMSKTRRKKRGSHKVLVMKWVSLKSVSSLILIFGILLSRK